MSTGVPSSSEDLPEGWRRLRDIAEVSRIERIDGVIRVSLHSGVELEWPDPDDSDRMRHG